MEIQHTTLYFLITSRFIPVYIKQASLHHLESLYQLFHRVTAIHCSSPITISSKFDTATKLRQANVEHQCRVWVFGFGGCSAASFSTSRAAHSTRNPC